MAAVLACGCGAVLSHESAAQLWGFRRRRTHQPEVSVPRPRAPRRNGITVHRRTDLGDERRRLHIPLTSPAQTLLDLSQRLDGTQLERAVNEADRLDLVNLKQLRAAADQGRAGAKLRGLLDMATFTLTDSELEQLFIPIARKAGLPRPETQERVNGFRVDFFFRAAGIVVEADSGRFHRTAAQQTRDRRRDHAHTLADLIPLRFTHHQIAYEASYVAGVLEAVARPRLDP